VPWRGLAFILPAPVIFGATIRGLGLVLSVAIVVLITGFASRKTSIRFALLLAIGLTVFCVALFHYGLGLPVRLFGPWTGPLARLGS
jgi:xanthine/uracil permease